MQCKEPLDWNGAAPEKWAPLYPLLSKAAEDLLTRCNFTPRP